MAADTERFYYVYSCDLDANVSLKIGNLEGKREKRNYKALIEDPQLRFSGLYQSSCSDLYVSCQLYADGQPLCLPTRTAYRPFNTRWNWNEWINLPLKYKDLPRSAQVALTIWDVYGPRKALLVGGTTVSLFGKSGTLRRGMHDLHVWPEIEADGSHPSKTPGKTSDPDDKMSSLAKLSKKHHKGRMHKVDWLDRLTFREIEMVNEKEKRSSDSMFLMVEFPRIHEDGIDFSVVYYEKLSDEGEFHYTPEIVRVHDPEILQENLVESKHHKLVRSVRSGTVSHEMKPNAAVRDQLNQIVGYPPSKVLTSEEKDLLWQFRFYLSSQKKALTKFLKCVEWNESHEAGQALDLMQKWSLIDVDDALELLSEQFTNPAVRKYAVSRLREANDDDLLLYLLQLVQALRYEPNPSQQAGFSPESAGEDNPLLESKPPEQQVALSESLKSVEPKGSYLESFLISRACRSEILANFLYWYLRVECSEDNTTKAHAIYSKIIRRYVRALMQDGVPIKVRKARMLRRQQQFVDKLGQIMKTVAQFGGNRKKKIEKLQSILQNPESVDLKEPLPLPLDPNVRITGVVADKATLFKSALMPAKFTFRTVDDKEYITIFKSGDDLRQDQLILQIIRLMDKLLMLENLDLKLTPYNVLATSTNSGCVQFIESCPVAEVLASDGSIQNFFRKYAPCEGAPCGISPEVMDTYVKSCAGYCVITYLLGIGDRHLDNLLLTKSGNLFHIDFGYILGRDPKPLPPPMKLSKEMVEAMGGAQSEFYQEFRRQCYTAFLHLRRSANLILNLFALMVDANVPDIALEPDKTVKKVEAKFRLDLSDEEAVHYLQSLIDESVSAMFAVVVEQIHKFAQYWRK
ncbi:phosphatidylinositol 3-kinase catalytic subunit type 3-like [Dendronephthya gigantea]|uniref:phosphatidylinositol 3-kinase catalytic subunit type 3-like n=1 Tax=Dendronephthya gigantea TaxID=151771 RepID=UPI00106BF897|nr:phosphatidylinositol 3-kinase catalytic subunit type 3-like [Dendronephthya gigantea]